MNVGARVAQHDDYGNGPYEVPLNQKAGRREARDPQRFVADMQDIFGSEKLAIVPTMSYDLDQKSELAHSTTGLKYAIRGRATVIEATVGERLASFQDPIKAILPVTMVDSHRVIVTTSEVVGGRALIVPERATARTVAVKRTSREVVLERYGGDLEMNLNLQHEPGMFKAELDLKLKAQQRELERVLIEIGYDTLLEGGMRLETAILRSSPNFNETIENGADGMEAHIMRAEAARIYYNKCFGIMNKSAFPMHSILSAAKYASAYSIGAPGSMMILPHGMPELLRYGRPEAMIFNINGLKTTDNKPITMELGTAHTDPATSIKMMTHIPLPTFEYGSANPRVGMGCLSEVVNVLTWYLVDGAGLPTKLVDARHRQTETLVASAAVPPGIYIRKTRVAMSSAILAAPGSDTGELLVGMPHTGVSTSQTDETMKMQLRVYLGAVLKRPESVVILPHVVCDGLVGQTRNRPYVAGHINTVGASNDLTKQNFEAWVESDDINDGGKHDFIVGNGLPNFSAGNLGAYAGQIPPEFQDPGGGGANAAPAVPPATVEGLDLGDACDMIMLASTPRTFTFYGQTVCAAGHLIGPAGNPIHVIKNQGHFGAMDDPEHPAAIAGLDGECHPSHQDVIKK